MNAEEVITEILEREKGFVDHPADRGGPTKYGITLRTLSEWRNAPVSAADVALLSESEARAIYRSRYVAPFLMLQDPALLGLIADIAVNHGTLRATKWLQEAIGADVDGIIGPQTLRLLQTCDRDELYRRLLRRRIVFYGEIISHDHSQAVFALGWLRRAASFV